MEIVGRKYISMKKIGVCGHFADGINMYDGQTVKTRVLYEELVRKMGANRVLRVDTKDWRKNPFKLVLNIVWLFCKCESLIVMPASNGVKVLIPMFSVLNGILRRKIHYIVIGGWLPEFIKTKNSLIKHIRRFDGVYVETEMMKKKLDCHKFDNIVVMPNFKRLQTIEEQEVCNYEGNNYKLCTFSRVMKEKGIEDAIMAVKEMNAKKGNVYTLDIYGQIEESYKDRFAELEKEFPEYIKYCGVIPYENSTSVLKNYFALLFPTHFRTEGFPGTIIDAYAAALPVIATNWESSSEIVTEGITGMLFQGEKELVEILESVLETPELINNMKLNCLRESRKYLPEVVVDKFVQYL